MSSPILKLVTAARLIDDARAQLAALEGRESLATEAAGRAERIHQGIAHVGRSVSSLQTLIERSERFGTIYADPPWQYENSASRGAAENHYRTMAVEAIAALPVAHLAATDAHLHLWTTNAFLFEARQVIEAWGFAYKSCLVWIKPQLGTGNYWRVSHEFLLLGIRGNAVFADKTQQSWLYADRTKHSAKPAIFRKLIEQVSPGPRLELFARCQAELDLFSTIEMPE
jgi:N6-adenosine-specific RNA methylase IME4